MSRPPHARDRVLRAARELVEREGARSLTLDRLSRLSGVTRGGILYHWPSRQALVEGLIENDLRAWKESTRSSPSSEHPITQHVRRALDPKDGVGALAASLLPEARQLPVVWDTVRRHDAWRFRDWAWDDDDIARYVLLLAAEGVFWRRLHGLEPDIPDLDARVRSHIEESLSDIDRRAACSDAVDCSQSWVELTRDPARAPH
ncbi:MAG: TetR/AcrR family transcriptional regulator [Pseudomarimonas sp.]